MPIYEYRCTDCGQLTELLRAAGTADEDPGPCPHCGGSLRRRFSRVAVKLMAWGFATTDGWVPDRPGGRHDFRTVAERAEKLSDTGEL